MRLPARSACARSGGPTWWGSRDVVTAARPPGTPPRTPAQSSTLVWGGGGVGEGLERGARQEEKGGGGEEKGGGAGGEAIHSVGGSTARSARHHVWFWGFGVQGLAPALCGWGPGIAVLTWQCAPG